MTTQKSGETRRPATRKGTPSKGAGDGKPSKESPPATRRAAAPGKSARRGPREARAANDVNGEHPLDATTREQMVAEAAYYMAERRGFACGGELEDWLAAEAAIDAQVEAVQAAEAGKSLF